MNTNEDYYHDALIKYIGRSDVFDGWHFEGEVIYENLVWKTDVKRKPTKSEFEANVVICKNEEPLKMLRAVRDGMLRQTDHWALSDTTEMTEAQSNYRQALRDITKTYSSLSEVVWPEKP